jgi:hypothetical protein
VTKTLTYDDYLRLCGLLTLAADHRRMLQAIERSACAITGQAIEDGGHTSDAIWGEGYSPERLMELLGIPVPTPMATLAEADQTIGKAMRIVGRVKELFPEEGS